VPRAFKVMLALLVKLAPLVWLAFLEPPALQA
jgi:hypothetical protein